MKRCTHPDCAKILDPRNRTGYCISHVTGFLKCPARVCAKCGDRIHRKNVSGFCDAHRPRTVRLKACKACGIAISGKSGFCHPHYVIHSVLGTVVSDERWEDYKYLRDTRRMLAADAAKAILAGEPVERIENRPVRSAGSAKAAADIVEYLSKRLRVPTSDIMSPRRFQHIVRARACAVQIMAARNWSYMAIARRLGFRDHSPVVNLVQRWPEYVASEPRLQAAVDGFAAGPVVALCAPIVPAHASAAMNNAGGVSLFRDIAA